MLFNKFLRICKKYGWTFDLFGGSECAYLTLYSNFAILPVELNNAEHNVNELFKRAIVIMKHYSNEHGVET